MYYYARFACASTDGNSVVVATSATYFPTDIKMIFLEYNFINGTLLNSQIWNYPVSVGTTDGRPLNIHENNGNFLVTGYIYPGGVPNGYVTIDGWSFHDTFYGTLAPSLTVGSPRLVDEDRDRSVYPNPGTNYFYLSGDEKLNEARIEIYNSIGQKVRSIEHYSAGNKIDASHLNNG